MSPAAAAAAVSAAAPPNLCRKQEMLHRNAEFLILTTTSTLLPPAAGDNHAAHTVCVCVCVHACQRLTPEGHAALDHVIQRDTGRPDIHLCRRKRARALWTTNWTTNLFKGQITERLAARPLLASNSETGPCTPPTECRYGTGTEERREERREGRKAGGREGGGSKAGRERGKGSTGREGGGELVMLVVAGRSASRKQGRSPSRPRPCTNKQYEYLGDLRRLERGCAREFC